MSESIADDLDITKPEKKIIDKTVAHLANAIATKNTEGTKLLLKRLSEKKHRKYVENSLSAFRQKKKVKNQHGENKKPDISILHVAVTFEDDGSEVVTSLIDLSPNVLHLQRESVYEGQTALHIAIARSNHKTVKDVLEKEKSYFSTIETKLVNRLAEGTRFTNTMMMGQSPLSVASLNCDKEMVDLLFKCGADILMKNTIDDTIFHSMIKYCAVYPDKVNEIKEMFHYLNTKLQNMERKLTLQDSNKSDTEEFKYQQETSYIWFEKNKKGLNPLQLAAKYGVVELFEYIINIKNVYCFSDTHDGLFDIQMYDITDIDTVSNRQATIIEKKMKEEKLAARTTMENVILSKENTCSFLRCSWPQTESVLEMMYDQKRDDSKTVIRVIETVPVKNVIRAKWEKYRWFHIIWMILHITFLSFLTAFLVERAGVFRKRELRLSVNSSSEYFVSALQWIGLIFSFLYFLLPFVILFVRYNKSPNNFKKYNHNLMYLILLFTFSGCYIIDTAYYAQGNIYNSGFFILAVICGWWFTVFFLRTFLYFSFFTELISRVIFGDLLRFSVVIGFELISFTAGMTIMFTGRTISSKENGTDIFVPDTSVDGYFPTMLTMFKLMLGLTEIDILYEANSPAIAIALFVSFVLLTYVLMINALIAMMSQTCALVLENRYPQWRIQQLSAILFLEEMSFLFFQHKCLPKLGEAFKLFKYSPIKRQLESHTRFLLEIHSMKINLATEEEMEAIGRRRRTITPFGFSSKTELLSTLFPNVSNNTQSTLNDTIMSSNSHDTDIPINSFRAKSKSPKRRKSKTQKVEDDRRYRESERQPQQQAFLDVYHIGLNDKV